MRTPGRKRTRRHPDIFRRGPSQLSNAKCPIDPQTPGRSGNRRSPVPAAVAGGLRSRPTVTIRMSREPPRRQTVQGGLAPLIRRRIGPVVVSGARRRKTDPELERPDSTEFGTIRFSKGPDFRRLPGGPG